ncbi:MAG: CDP-alcohol phosphatidyltransferase family protein [Patescibacteria group bacterium]
MGRIVTYPNIITITRGICGIIGISIALQSQMFLWGALFFTVFGMVPDLIDGWVARRFDQKSRLGEILDPLVDKVLFYSAMFFVFMEYAWIPAVLILFVCDFFSTVLHFTKSGGAVTSGKRKFALQCVSLVFFALGVLLSKEFFAFANVAMIASMICALRSLKQRLS